MQKVYGFVLICGLLLTGFVGRLSAQGGTDGKKIFVDNKCNACHSITALNIAVKKSADEEKSDKESPDLSGVGLERNADWLAKYLMKKESIKGEKHLKKFKGSEGDLAVLAQLLETLKTKPKK